MKLILSLMPLLGATFVSGQPKSEVFSVSPEKPVIGHTLTVSYHADASRALLSNVTQIDLYVLLCREEYGDARPRIYSLEKAGPIWKTSFVLEDSSAKLLLFRFASGDKFDDNNGNVWNLMIFDKDGKPVRGAHATRAHLMLGGWLSFGHPRDYKGVNDELRKEKELYPGNWRATFLHWEIMAPGQQDKIDKAKIRTELDDLYRMNQTNDDAIPGIVSWYLKLGDTATANRIREEAVLRDPHGSFSRSVEWEKIQGERDASVRANLMEEFLARFPDSDDKERTAKLKSLFAARLQSKEYDSALHMLSNILKPDWRMYDQLASDLLDDGKRITDAVEEAKTAVKLSRESDSTDLGFYSTRKSWENQHHYNTAMALTTFAQGLSQRGKLDDVEKAYQEAYGLTAGSNFGINALYVESLMKNRKYERAISIGSECVKKRAYLPTVDPRVPDMLDLLKDAFIRQYGSGAGFDSLIASKDKLFDEMITEANRGTSKDVRMKVTKSRMHEPAADFTLKALNEKSISLSSLRGKVVVIDYWATWCDPCVSSFPYLQTVYNKYKQTGKVIFLAIDTWERGKESVKKFVEENRLQLPVLIDEGSADNFGVSVLPTKFIIDKQGNIAFRSSGFNGPELVEELVQEIDMLLAE